MNKISSNSSKGCILWVALEYPKELQNYTMIVDLYNTPTSNVNKLVPNFWRKEVCASLCKLATSGKSKLSPHGGFSLKTVEPHQ